jgi:hypothetical protein
MGDGAFQHCRPQAFAVGKLADHHGLFQVGRNRHHGAGFGEAAQDAHPLAGQGLFVADFGLLLRAGQARVDRHGRIILSGWIIGMTGNETRDCRQRLVHQRVLTPVLEPTHLPQDGRGMQSFAPRQLPQRCAFFCMV